VINAISTFCRFAELHFDDLAASSRNY